MTGIPNRASAGRACGVRGCWRPRVRSTDPAQGEIELAPYRTFADTDLLAMVASMLAGLTTRQYPTGLEPVDDQTADHAKIRSKSAVSRQFVSATAERPRLRE